MDFIPTPFTSLWQLAWAWTLSVFLSYWVIDNWLSPEDIDTLLLTEVSCLFRCPYFLFTIIFCYKPHITFFIFFIYNNFYFLHYSWFRCFSSWLWQFLGFSLVWKWPWQFSGVLVRNFICHQTESCLVFFSWKDKRKIAEVNCHFHHIISSVYAINTIYVGLIDLTEVRFMSFLHCTIIPFHLPFPYRTLWKASLCVNPHI